MEYRIKFNGVTTLSEARYAAAAGAFWIGFPMDGSLPAARVQEIAGWLQGPELVAEYKAWPDGAARLDHYQILGLDWMEGWLSGSSMEEIPGQLILLVDAQTDLEAAPESAVLHALNPEIWLQRRAERPEQHWMVNLSAANPAELTWLDAAQPYAYSLDAIGEDQTGLRDFSAWDDWLEALENL
jgi:hypothetical protein